MQGIDPGFRAGLFQGRHRADRQGPGPTANARIGCPGISDLAGMPKVAADRGTAVENDIAMETINREHPEYVARKAIWKQYKDLYAGGEQLRTNASQYLVRRHKEPGDIYMEERRVGKE